MSSTAQIHFRRSTERGLRPSAAILPYTEGRGTPTDTMQQYLASFGSCLSSSSEGAGDGTSLLCVGTTSTGALGAAEGVAGRAPERGGSDVGVDADVEASETDAAILSKASTSL